MKELAAIACDAFCGSLSAATGGAANCIDRQKLEAFLPASLYSTVTLFAKLRGLSTSQPRATAMW